MFEIVVNLSAGKGTGKTALAKVEKKLKENGIEYRVHKTEYKGHATEIVKTLTQNGAKIIVMGGDGTFGEALNGIVDFENTTLGLIPCGTGNDYGKFAGISKDVNTSLRVILEGKTAYTDFIEIGKARCLNVAGGGMDTDVLVTYEAMKHFHGKIKYFASLLKVLNHFKFHKIRISIDGGETVEKTVFLCSIANGKYIGGGLPISPHSVLNDGKINVIVVNEMKRSKIFGSLLKFLRGKHLDLPCSEEYLCESVTLEMLDECKVQIDGEILEDKLIECRVVHDKLRIFTKE